MTYYVMSDTGIEKEFDNLEEADNYIDMSSDPSALWIGTDDDGFDNHWEEMDDFERESYLELLRKTGNQL